MIHLTPYKLFENERPVISYDFDGVLHCSVIGLDPVNWDRFNKWIPFTEMHKQMKEDAKTHKIIVVSARPPQTIRFIEAFIEKYKLPVEEIYCTDDKPKLPVLEKTGAIKHYDDNNSMANQLKNTGIEFVLVNPITKKTTLYEESLPKNTYKVYHGTNSKFEDFDLGKTSERVIWFTDSIDSIKNQTHGGDGNKYIMTRYITLNNPAGWDEYEKYSIQELEHMKYDGVILPEDDKTDYIVFDPKNIHKSIKENINEGYNDSWLAGGFLLIKGEKLEDDKQRLYAVPIKTVVVLDRYKKADKDKDKPSGVPAQMAMFGNMFFRLSVQEGRIKANQVDVRSKGSLNKMLGITAANNSIVLNSNKTPLHYESLKIANIPTLINKLGSSIMQIEGIRWNG